METGIYFKDQKILKKLYVHKMQDIARWFKNSPKFSLSIPKIINRQNFMRKYAHDKRFSGGLTSKIHHFLMTSFNYNDG